MEGVRTDQMLAEPLGCGGFCHWKLVAIGVEVSAGDKHKLLGLERLLIDASARYVSVIVSCDATIISSGVGEMRGARRRSRGPS